MRRRGVSDIGGTTTSGADRVWKRSQLLETDIALLSQIMQRQEDTQAGAISGSMTESHAVQDTTLNTVIELESDSVIDFDETQFCLATEVSPCRELHDPLGDCSTFIALLLLECR